MGFALPRCTRLRLLLTNCLRVIRNAWHFHYALIYVIKV
ncbi:DUF3265 domain-containing protein [Vibrio sp. CAU 1672]|nr:MULTISPECIES: DUF3265 domain-containing protein [Vibrio]MDF2154358.1 DUF3265 domain-containing protein [Vibrio sp. CAU 1672]MDF4750795.1 DUF3265 domain-containing protein [Vibrio parahaemolyticus]